jgi:precorrin-6B methylase 2
VTAPAVVFSACLVSLLALGGCTRGGDAPPPPAGQGDPALEQARYDRERQPDALLAAMGLRACQHVADIGAGTGLMTVHLARTVGPCGQVVATDVDADVLELMKSRLDAAGVGGWVERRQVPPDEPGLGNESFDAILLSEVDHYLRDAAAWLRLAAARLSATGVLVITNRVYHRAKALAAATAAGLRLRAESSPSPSHFIAVFERPPR